MSLSIFDLRVNIIRPTHTKVFRHYRPIALRSVSKILRNYSRTFEPFHACKSVWQTPENAIFTKTSSGPAVGTAISLRSMPKLCQFQVGYKKIFWSQYTSAIWVRHLGPLGSREGAFGLLMGLQEPCTSLSVCLQEIFDTRTGKAICIRMGSHGLRNFLGAIYLSNLGRWPDKKECFQW